MIKKPLRSVLALSILLILSACDQLTPLGKLIHDQLQLSPPSLSAPAADANGYSNTDIIVTLDHADPTVELYYTTDRSDPSGQGVRYTGPFTLSGHNDPKLVKAIARKENQLDSEAVQAEFLILYDAVQIPVFSPPPGSFNSALSVSLSSGSGGAAVWYTLDGTDPRSSPTRTLYSGAPIPIADDGTPDGSRVVVNSVARIVGLPDSPTATGEFIVLYDTLTVPTLTPAAQQSDVSFDVTITSPDGADIWFTTDGSSPVSGTGSSAVPSGNATRYTGPIPVNWSGYDSRTIKAACFAAGFRPSPVQIGSYFQQVGQTPAPVVELYDSAVGTSIAPFAGRVYSNAVETRMRVAAPVSGTRYFYTTDGTMPMIDIDGSIITALTPATLELTGSAAVASSEDDYDLNLIAVNPPYDPSILVTTLLTVDRTPPVVTGLNESGFFPGVNGNRYMNAAAWSLQNWYLEPTGNESGTFEWQFLGDVSSNVLADSRIEHEELSARLASADGNYTLQVRLRDRAGNPSGWTNFPFIRDTAAPTRDFSQSPQNYKIGQYLSTVNQYYVQFSEAMNPASVDMTVRPIAGSAVGGLVASNGNRRFDIDVPGGLDLDREYAFSLAGARDLADNPYAGPFLSARFVTGSVYWSAGNVIYRAGITPRPGYPVQTWYTGPAGSTITDVEVADYRVFWSEVSGGQGIVKYANGKQDFAGTVFTVDTATGVGPINDIEIDDINGRVYYTTPDSTWTIRFDTYPTGIGNGEEHESVVGNPPNLAWDGSTYYWSDSAFAHFSSGAGVSTPPVGVVSGTTNHAMEHRWTGTEHQFYGLNVYSLPVFPESAVGSSGIARRRFSSDLQTSNGSNSATVQSNLWGNGTVYGGDLEIVEVGGVNKLYILAPTVNGTPEITASNEYCGVFSMDLDLSGLTTLYDPAILALTRTRAGGLGIDTQ